MQINMALYEVVIGYAHDTDFVDRWNTRRVLAATAKEAMQGVRLHKHEFVSEVKLIGRAEEHPNGMGAGSQTPARAGG